jgi:hypothetical protein
VKAEADPAARAVRSAVYLRFMVVGDYVLLK